MGVMKFRINGTWKDATERRTTRTGWNRLDSCPDCTTYCQATCTSLCNDTCKDYCKTYCQGCDFTCSNKCYDGCNGCSGHCSSCTGSVDQINSIGESHPGTSGESHKGTAGMIQEILNGPVYDNYEITYSNSLPRVYIGGTWKEVTSAKTCINGTWKTISTKEIKEETHEYSGYPPGIKPKN